MVEEGDLDDKLEDKATNEVVDDVKKVAMEGVDKERKQVAMKVANTNCLDDLIDPCHPCLPCHPCHPCHPRQPRHPRHLSHPILTPPLFGEGGNIFSLNKYFHAKKFHQK